VTNAVGFYGQVNNLSTGTITNGYGVEVPVPQNSGGGVFTNFYGVYIANPTGITNSWGLYSLANTNYMSGKLGIGVTAPTKSLEINGSIKLDTAGNGITYPDGTVQTTASIPGSGTITKVTAGTDLTGGGSSGAVTLNLDTTKVPTLAATTNTFTGTGGIHAVSFTGNGAGLTNVTAVNSADLGGVAASGYAQLGTANSFTGGEISMTVPTVASGFGTTALLVTGGTSTDSSGSIDGGPAIYAIGGTETASNGLPNFGIIAVGGPTGATGQAFAAAGISANGGDTTTYGGQGGMGINSTGSNGNGGNYAGGDGIDAYAGNGSGTGAGAAGGQFVGGTNGGGAFGLTDGDGIDATGGSDTTGGNGGMGGKFTGGSGDNGGYGVYAVGGNGSEVAAFAGEFAGNLDVSGAITAGTKDFKIDHPLDPANKYLYHASVESSEMMDIYTGNATTDGGGEAVVRLPDWFESLNTDFRYQLTVIGQFAQAIVAQRIGGGQFVIRTDKPNVDVSWQVTAVRQDAFAKAHPLQVEVEKPKRERGYYVHPELYGAPHEKQVVFATHPNLLKGPAQRKPPVPQPSQQRRPAAQNAAPQVTHLGQVR
jgi:hypothetical protein